MKDGLEYQFKLFEKLAAEGKIELQTLEESGEFFRSSFKTTPATTIVCESDWKDDCK